jgi:hypothetical protein
MLMVRQEIGMMRAQLETTKFQIIQWLFGVVTGAGALGLGNSSGNVSSNLSSLYPITQLNGVVYVYYKADSFRPIVYADTSVSNFTSRNFDLAFSFSKLTARSGRRYG